MHALLTSVLDGSECSVSRPGRFTPGIRAMGIHWTGDGVGRDLFWIRETEMYSVMFNAKYLIRKGKLRTKYSYIYNNN
jgi:hypothetical protein